MVLRREPMLEDVEEGFNYNSNTNTEWDTVKGLRKLIIEHIDPNFSI